ncbi:hypothetical protein TNCV_4678141 [Trichonephila clavipes]|nr:hypothetical protein TNCV_4678141 [Trichonephila clavipes]
MTSTGIGDQPVNKKDLMQESSIYLSFFFKIRSWRSSSVKFITEATPFNTSLIKSSDFDKRTGLAASWKNEYFAPLIVNKSSYETIPFFSRNDSSPG